VTISQNRYRIINVTVNLGALILIVNHARMRSGLHRT
jgi:hypothetical protein